MAAVSGGAEFMVSAAKEIQCDVFVIGAGMAGMAAALFAARREMDTVQAGISGEINFASGLLDLLGVHPVTKGGCVDDPWEGIQRLCLEEPRHPYALLKAASIRQSLEDFLKFMETAGYPHVRREQENLGMPTPIGSVKTTYAVPHTMGHGPSALVKKLLGLLVDFHGLKGYSARQIALNLADRWPGLRPVTLAFPGSRGELYTEGMARALDHPEPREKLVAALRPHLDDVQVVALPAVLGVHRTLDVLDDLQQGLGLPVFEIPTMVPSVTGLRIREIFAKHLPAMGIRTLYQQRVLSTERTADGRWRFAVGRGGVECLVEARAAVLCSGRFFGKGLHADRHGIRETVFRLPVVQPAHRQDWHHPDLLHPEGHPINRTGVATDQWFRPIDSEGRMIHPDLFAAGSVLAHQDWKRQKCGSGLAIATAYGAVEACERFLG